MRTHPPTLSARCPLTVPQAWPRIEQYINSMPMGTIWVYMRGLDLALVRISRCFLHSLERVCMFASLLVDRGESKSIFVVASC